MPLKRTSVIGIVLTVAVVSSVAGWLASRRIQSPADAALQTAPPTPSPILVPVERRVLRTTVVTRGTGRFGLPQPISVVPSPTKKRAGLIATLPLPNTNTQFREGEVVLSASGRPLFVLQGEAPVYRDMGPGISGNDVLQLEKALERLGFAPGPVDGRYDRETGAAVAAWYKSNGWEPFGPTKEQRIAIRDLEQRLNEAKNAEAKMRIAASTTALDVASARMIAERNNRKAAAELATKRAALDRLQDEMTVRNAAYDIKQAKIELELTKAAVDLVRTQGETAIQRAANAQKAATVDVELAAATSERIVEEFAAAKDRLGVQVPADELVFLPVLPVRVKEITARVGDPASGEVMTVTDNRLAVDSSLPLDVAPLVKEGMPVVIDEQSLGIKAKGNVAAVAKTPGTHGVDGYHIYFEVRVTETSMRLDGASVRLTIPVKSTGGAVTAVPASALFMGADGTPKVRVRDEDGSLRNIVVEPGMAAEGYVEVTPAEGALTSGMLVVVGYDTPENATPQ